MERFEVLPKDVVKEIIAYKEQKWRENDLSPRFPNVIIKDNILNILDLFCTVLYYPLEDEKNNGFHLTGLPNRKGQEQHFVFINTAQSLEKQVFTAAHELGHIWEVDEHIIETCGLDPNESERIINRFAAELILPEDAFKQQLLFAYQKYKSKDGSISVIVLFRIVADLMNTFFAPMKAIFMRLVEIEAVDPKIVNDLFIMLDSGGGDLIVNTIDNIIQENGYTELQKGTGKKLIAGLAPLLDAAEREQSVPQSKIDRLRELFDLKRYDIAGDFDKPININGI